MQRFREKDRRLAAGTISGPLAAGPDDHLHSVLATVLLFILFLVLLAAAVMVNAGGVALLIVSSLAFGWAVNLVGLIRGLSFDPMALVCYLLCSSFCLVETI